MTNEARGLPVSSWGLPSPPKNSDGVSVSRRERLPPGWRMHAGDRVQQTRSGSQPSFATSSCDPSPQTRPSLFPVSVRWAHTRLGLSSSSVRRCISHYTAIADVIPSSTCTWAEAGPTSLPVAGWSCLSLVLRVLWGRMVRGPTLRTHGRSDVGR